MTSLLEQAGCWWLQSGIQDAGGGVARYYRADTQTNLPVSNEITGYAVSALAYLHQTTANPAFRDAALRGARFLADQAWAPDSSTFPFEPGSGLAYFFDTGIIARGLMAAWRLSGEERFVQRAREAALSLAFDFLGESGFHTAIALPEKQPLPEEPRWSRQPGCFQLKAAVVWRELDDASANRMFQMLLAYALATHESFLDPAREPQRERLMDRLHAYSYFLEGLLWAPEHAEARDALASGLDRAAALYREIAPGFERSDVAAQLLRVRLIAHHLDLAGLDEPAAREEAQRAASFQFTAQEHATDPRLQGGFCFGAKNGELLPYANPVSTAFCTQALELWRQHQAGAWDFDLSQLI